MNKNQKRLTVAAMVVFLATLVWAPWVSKNGFDDLGPLWQPPFSTNSRLRLEVLVVEWLAISVLYVGCFFLLKGAVSAPKPPETSPPFAVTPPTSEKKIKSIHPGSIIILAAIATAGFLAVRGSAPRQPAPLGLSEPAEAEWKSGMSCDYKYSCKDEAGNDAEVYAKIGHTNVYGRLRINEQGREVAFAGFWVNEKQLKAINGYGEAFWLQVIGPGVKQK